MFSTDNKGCFRENIGLERRIKLIYIMPNPQRKEVADLNMRSEGLRVPASSLLFVSDRTISPTRSASGILRR